MLEVRGERVRMDHVMIIQCWNATVTLGLENNIFTLLMQSG